MTIYVICTQHRKAFLWGCFFVGLTPRSKYLMHVMHIKISVCRQGNKTKSQSKLSRGERTVIIYKN